MSVDCRYRRMFRGISASACQLDVLGMGRAVMRSVESYLDQSVFGEVDPQYEDL
jgi:hypothetical protein